MTNRLLILLLLTLSAALYSFLVAPTFSLVLAKYDFVNSLKNVLSQAEALQERRDELLNQKNSVPTRQRELLQESIAPYSKSEVVRFILALEVLLLRSGLGSDVPYTIGREKKEEDGLTVVPVTFNFDRIRYATLLNFIGQLSRWDRGARIGSVRILSADIASDPSAVRASVTIEALFLQEFITTL